MALALYRNIANYALTVPSGDITGAYPATLTVQPNSVFIGNTNDQNLIALVGLAKLSVSSPGFTTVPVYSDQITGPAAGL